MPHEQGLDHQRADSGGGRDVLQDAGERDPRAVDRLEVLLGAGIQLGPDLALIGVQDLQAALHVGAMEHAGVGDQHQLDGVQAVPAFDLGAGGDDLVEVAVGRRLAVAGKGDVVQAPPARAAPAETAACS